VLLLTEVGDKIAGPRQMQSTSRLKVCEHCSHSTQPLLALDTVSAGL